MALPFPCFSNPNLTSSRGIRHTCKDWECEQCASCFSSEWLKALTLGSLPISIYYISFDSAIKLYWQITLTLCVLHPLAVINGLHIRHVDPHKSHWLPHRTRWSNKTTPTSNFQVALSSCSCVWSEIPFIIRKRVSSWPVTFSGPVERKGNVNKKFEKPLSHVYCTLPQPSYILSSSSCW